jgi:hypothetical protein
MSTTYKSQKPLNLIPLLLSVQLIPGGGWRIVKGSDVAAVINYSIAVTPNAGTPSTANYSISSLDSSLYEDISLTNSSSGTQTLTILPGAYFIGAPSSAQVVIPAPPVSVSSPNPTTWRISAELGSTVNYYIQGNRYDNSQFYSVGYSVLMNTNPRDIALLNLSDDNYARLGGSQTLYIGAGPYPILANGGSNKISVPPIPVQVGSGGGTWTISGPQNALVSYSLSVKNNVGGITTNYPSNSVTLSGGAAIVYPVNSPNSVQRLQILSGNPSYSIGTNYFSLLAY